MFFRSVVCAFVAIVFMARPAYAYLEPSMSWMVVQGAVAIVAGGLVCLKLYWRKLKDLFRSTPTTSEGETAEPGEDFRKVEPGDQQTRA